MNDPRDIKLAQMLVNYSVRVQPGEKVLIDYTGEECVPLVKRIVREVYAAAGVPFVKCDHPIVTREFLMGCSEEQVKLQDDADLYLMKQMDAYIGIRAAANAAEFSDVYHKRRNGRAGGIAETHRVAARRRTRNYLKSPETSFKKNNLS